MDNYLAIASGVAFVAASAAAWLGRWTGWTRTFITAHLPVPVTLLPAFGFLLIALGLGELDTWAWSKYLSATALLILVMAVVLMLWNPAWWGPSWYRQLKSTGEEIEPDLRDPLTAATFAAAARGMDPKAASDPTKVQR